MQFGQWLGTAARGTGPERGKERSAAKSCAWALPKYRECHESELPELPCIVSPRASGVHKETRLAHPWKTGMKGRCSTVFLSILS